MNQSQNTENLQTSFPAHDCSTAAYTPQHNRDKAFPADAHLTHLAAQLEANLPAAAAIHSTTRLHQYHTVTTGLT